MDEQSENLFEFEDYCGSCDNYPEYFKDDMIHCHCPYRDKFITGEYNGETKWKEINCNNFWD